MEIGVSPKGSLGEWIETVLVLLVELILGGAVMAGLRMLEVNFRALGPKTENRVSLFKRLKNIMGGGSSESENFLWVNFPLTFPEGVESDSHPISGSELNEIQDQLVAFPYYRTSHLVPENIGDEVIDDAVVLMKDWKNVDDTIELGYAGYEMNRLLKEYPTWIRRAFFEPIYMEASPKFVPEIWLLTDFAIYFCSRSLLTNDQFFQRGRPPFEYEKLENIYEREDSNPDPKEKKGFDAASFMLLLMARGKFQARLNNEHNQGYPTLRARVVTVLDGPKNKRGYTLFYIPRPVKWEGRKKYFEMNIGPTLHSTGALLGSDDRIKEIEKTLLTRKIEDPSSDVRIVDLGFENKGTELLLKCRHWSKERIRHLFS